MISNPCLPFARELRGNQSKHCEIKCSKVGKGLDTVAQVLALYKPCCIQVDLLDTARGHNAGWTASPKTLTVRIEHLQCSDRDKLSKCLQKNNSNIHSGQDSRLAILQASFIVANACKCGCWVARAWVPSVKIRIKPNGLILGSFTQYVLNSAYSYSSIFFHLNILDYLPKQSPIQSQFEQSLLTVQNAAQRTFSLLFPLLRLGRSAQVSCAVRGPFVISSLRMDLYLSELYHHLCDLQSVWGKNYLPNPKTGKWSVWYESAEYRGKERGWRGWVFVRAWVWVGGSIKIFEQKATNMSTYSTWTCLQVKARSQHDMSFRPVGWFHFLIVTAHKFFVLPHNLGVLSRFPPTLGRLLSNSYDCWASNANLSQSLLWVWMGPPPRPPFFMSAEHKNHIS